MTATGPSAKTSLPVTLTAGTVHTEIVVAAPGGGIQIINLVDAAGARQAPTGGSGGKSLSYRQRSRRSPGGLALRLHSITGLQPVWRHAGHSLGKDLPMGYRCHPLHRQFRQREHYRGRVQP